MVERDRAAQRRSLRRAGAWATAASAAAFGSVQLVQQWKDVLLGQQRPASLEQAAGSSAEINRGATLGTVQTVTGNVAQDNSRNIVLYNNAFRVEVVRATDEASAAKQQLRDEILTVLDGLVGEVGTRSLAPDAAREMGQRLGAILDAAPVSAYHLQGREFTLRPGTAWYLPGGEDSVAFVGPPEDGAPNAIAIRRNGRVSTMAVGAVREFQRGSENCRLLLHEVAADFSTAAFSYTCRS